MLLAWVISASALRENGYEIPVAVPGFSVNSEPRVKQWERLSWQPLTDTFSDAQSHYVCHLMVLQFSHWVTVLSSASGGKVDELTIWQE